jgi:PAS domain S-box-containing protein
VPRALSQHTGAIRVLHVDDEPAFADTARAYLEREDDRLTVTTASSASEGLEHLAEAPVDCIVSDYQMPGMDGLTFLEAVREDHPDLPFVLFTGQGSEAAASDAISAGATDYLRKGSGTDQYELLANRVRNVVEQSRAKQQVRDVETRYSALFENLGEPAVEVTFEGDTAVVETVNERFETVFGVEASAIVGDPLDAEITPEDERDSARELNRRSKVGESIEQEVQRRTADGPRWFLLRTVSFPVGEERRAYAIYVDITERKDREQKLGTRATAMEASIDGMAILDADDEYVFVNQAHADAYRYDGPSAFLGETWRMCYDDDELERFEEEVIPAMREEGRWRGRRSEPARTAPRSPRNCR